MYVHLLLDQLRDIVTQPLGGTNPKQSTSTGMETTHRSSSSMMRAI